ncbi:MAG TPA: hypothetical protein VMR86_08995 [Myxococcota bacterium]|nr:hypothetical protein [Myxococcota bacterium]
MRGVRVFLVVFGVCAVAAAIALPYLFRRVAELSESLNADWETWKRETEAFAAAHEQAECVPEALRRSAECGEGVTCGFHVSSFIDVCLARARHSPELCRDVPDDPAALQRYPHERCAESNAQTPACMLIHMTLAQRCAAQRAKRHKS